MKTNKGEHHNHKHPEPHDHKVHLPASDQHDPSDHSKVHDDPHDMKSFRSSMEVTVGNHHDQQHAGHDPASSGHDQEPADPDRDHRDHHHGAEGSPQGNDHDHQGDSAQGHDHKDHHGMMVADFRRRFWISLILTIPILILSPMIQMFLGVHWRFAGDYWLLAGLSTVLFVYGGKPFLTGAVDEIKSRTPGMMTLIAFAISVAWLYSLLAVFVLSGSDFFWELATLIVIMLLGHWIEMRSVMGASQALDELLKLMPEEAHLIQADGSTRETPVSHLVAGDRILVKPGEKIPIDGAVFDGSSEVDESMVTGESIPVEKQSGDDLIGGSINGDGLLRFSVTKTGEDTFLSQVIKLVREAQSSKSRTQRLADTAAKWLFYVAVFAGGATFLYWMIARGDLQFAMERAVTVIIISCPHALGLAIPLVTAVSTSLGAKRGLLIRNRQAFEQARNVNAVVFDKTGTLTKGEFGVTDIKPRGISEGELLAMAAAIEINSEHPLAKGIVREAQRQQISWPAVTDFRNLPGKGLTGIVGHRQILIGSPGMLRSEGIDFDQNHHDELTNQGMTVVYVLADRVLQGSIALNDIIRESSRRAIAALHNMGIEAVMLTGDNRNAAAHVASQLGIDTVLAEVLPEEKSTKIQELQAQGKITAMTGDGINDAPALARADLGIAIGAGTDVAIETADIILVKSDPLDVVHIIELSRVTYRKMIQNLIWATAYNVIALPLAAGVLLHRGILISPALGAVLMSLSTIIVAINARFLKTSEIS